MAEAKKTTKKTTTKKKSAPKKKAPKKVVEETKQKEVVAVEKPKVDVDTSDWKIQGFPSEKHYKRFLGIS